MLLLEASSTTFIAINSASRAQSQCLSRKSDWLTGSQLTGQQVWKNAHVSQLPVTACCTAPNSTAHTGVCFCTTCLEETPPYLLSVTSHRHTSQGTALTAGCMHPSVLTLSLLMSLSDNHLPLPPDFHKEHPARFLSSSNTASFCHH